MRKTTAAAMAFVCSVTAGAVWAKGDWKEKFKEMDSNHDGAVTLEEYQAGKEAKFHEVDADGDGKVTMDEKEAYMKMKHDKREDDDSNM